MWSRIGRARQGEVTVAKCKQTGAAEDVPGDVDDLASLLTSLANTEE